MQVNKIQRNINFGTTDRAYYLSKNSDSKKDSNNFFRCTSWLYRDDLDWDRLAKYENTHFSDKDKVNIVMYAASDGSEAYTKIMSLYENVCKDDEKKVKKFFPIQAYDIDKEILKAANSGLIKTIMVDRMLIQMRTENYEDYFEKSDKDLKIMDDAELQGEKTLKAKKILTNNVKFNYGDMFKKIFDIKDNSNTIVMCRNILGYFDLEDVEKFIHSVAKVLKSGSLFTVGNHDSVLYNMKEIIEKAGFKEVMNNVYKKV